MIDLRSDTVTRPSDAMRKAMAGAEVGDDWFGDDPSVRRLEERAAEVTGKEAALFVASGTMANQIALRIFVRPGHEFVAEARAHVATTENNAAASLSGIVARPVHAPYGRLAAEQVAEALQPDPYRVRVVDLVAVENTHQAAGGTVVPLDTMEAIRDAARGAGVPVYLDGARIFNASVVSGVGIEAFAAQADATMFALSKGLGAPVGSVLCGSTEMIGEARRVRIQLGGGWRQAGILAAAGLLALEEGPARLVEDHDLARTLAEGIADALPDAVDLASVETNIVYVDPEPTRMSASDIVERLRGGGVLAGVVGGRVRMVTHLDVGTGEIEKALSVWRELAG